jgi:hypothetical protein
MLKASVNGVSEVLHQLRGEQVNGDGERADKGDCGNQQGFGSHGTERSDR